ncbi:adenine phosphoribosyltransferase [Aquimarina sp. U1-2]|uniref:adenine phosphoribosyltransferase n=1 Tax=Aquimarina sp. U1-2 TaxID=2823141 RepID=UPI001AED0EEC|nr:adenine phosphoribosyltransferase [Aquimarina sp. U1-2]MBP2830852.1 adenine phosphoribosyltransferase [Aquimarina sp. U1-2]
MKIENFIRDISDFPKPGIQFKDITPLLLNYNALVACANQLADLVPVNTSIDKVIGVESRGFIMGAMLAERLQAGFIPVRKKGKLPHTIISKEYDLEYGSDTLEIHADAISKGEHILVHDDVLATGGTASTVCSLVEELGGVVIQCNFIIELNALKGRDHLHVPVAAVLQY